MELLQRYPFSNHLSIFTAEARAIIIDVDLVLYMESAIAVAEFASYYRPIFETEVGY